MCWRVPAPSRLVRDDTTRGRALGLWGGPPRAIHTQRFLLNGVTSSGGGAHHRMAVGPQHPQFLYCHSPAAPDQPAPSPKVVGRRQGASAPRYTVWGMERPPPSPVPIPSALPL